MVSILTIATNRENEKTSICRMTHFGNIMTITGPKIEF